MSSKLYLQGTGINKVYLDPQHPLTRLRHAILGTAPASQKAYHVLKDIDIEVYAGEIVGIIGRNGAGKTTLLGILGGIIEPTSGSVSRYGKLATLLETTSGFNKEFSGRENAALFCSVHGVSERSSRDRVERIRDFADVGRYFDLPMRTYSSGMQARVGFACAVNVDAELIIIDETLGVGDASFRLKCYEQIESMKKSGQTFLLVSHNQNVIANFCTRALVIEAGEKRFDGPTFEATEVYKQIRAEHEQGSTRVRKSESLPSKKARPFSEKLTLTEFDYEEDMTDGLRRSVISAVLVAREDVLQPAVSFGIRNHQGVAICAYKSQHDAVELPPLRAGERLPLRITFENRLLAGEYFITASSFERIRDVISQTSLHQNVLQFTVVRSSSTIGIVDMGFALTVRERQSV